MGAPDGNRLIEELIANPLKFHESGDAHALLQEYFEGLPIETLSPLLTSTDVMVQRSAVFIASELGEQAQSVLDQVAPLVSSADRHVAYGAMEVLLVCATGERAHQCIPVFGALERGDATLRRMAMDLVARADTSQLTAALRYFESRGPRCDAHRRGVAQLLSLSGSWTDGVTALLASSDPLERKYGAIAVSRISRKCASLLHDAASLDDPDIQAFVRNRGCRGSEGPAPSDGDLEQWRRQCAATPGRNWRVLAHDGARAVEHADEGIFDELVVDHWLHIEQMDEREWWIRVGDAELLVTVGADGAVTVDVERGAQDAIRGTTKIRDDGHVPG